MAKRYSDGYYEGNEGRRTQEMQDAGMIREDRSAVANMPQTEMYKPWGGDKMYMNSNLDDTIRGVDRQKNEDLGMAKRHLGVHKW